MSSLRKQIAKALLLYLLTSDEVSALEQAILVNMQKAAQASYRWAMKGAGIPQEWMLSEALKNDLAQLAKDHAESVAQTYQEDLQRTANTFMDAYEEANGSLEGVTEPLQEMLNEWSQKRTEFKAEQVSQYETNLAGNKGTQAFINDTVDGEYDEEFDEADIDNSMLMVGVLPESAATEDECMDIAGTCLPVGDAIVTYPPLPLHLLCPHYLIVFIGV